MPNLSCFYTPPPGLANGHLQTLFPTLFRREIPLKQQRVRIAAGDDFLDLDVSLSDREGGEASPMGMHDNFPGAGGPFPDDPKTASPFPNSHEPASRAAIIISHGLEGDSRRKYVRGMAKIFIEAGCDAIAWNQPGCGGEPCRSPRIYHMGETSDLRRVVDYALATGYTRIGLVGFSMGGNQILRFAGEADEGLAPVIKGLAVFSVPCELNASVARLNRRSNHMYMRYFMRSLHPKIRDLHRRFPEAFANIDGLSKIFTFSEFDERFTAPLNGFKSATDYYTRTASLPLLERIKVPTLLVNAADDPFLSLDCYPYGAAEKNPDLFLKVPRSGGHTGFVTFNAQNRYWSEQNAHDFLMPLLAQD